MARNGIALKIDASLGLAVSGVLWIPVPDEGVPQWMLELRADEYTSARAIAAALCERDKLDLAKPLPVLEPTWAAVEAWAVKQQQEHSAWLEKVKVANAKVDEMIAAYEAAIANPQASEILTCCEELWGLVWRFESKSHAAIVDATNKGALRNVEDRVRTEADRRSAESTAQFCAMAAELSDEEFLAKYREYDAERLGLKDRYRAIKRVLNEKAELQASEKKKADIAKIREVLAQGPAHLLERYDAGFLPEDELHVVLAEALFGKIEMPLYEPMIDSEFVHDSQCYEENVRYRSVSYTEALTAEQWATYKSALEVAAAFGFELSLRRHSAVCRNCEGEPIERLSMRIDGELGGISLHRLYKL